MKKGGPVYPSQGQWLSGCDLLVGQKDINGDITPKFRKRSESVSFKSLKQAPYYVFVCSKFKHVENLKLDRTDFTKPYLKFRFNVFT